MTAVRRRISIPNERFVDGSAWRRITGWYVSRIERGIKPTGTVVTRWDDFACYASVFETDDAEIAAVLAALAADGPVGADRVMALIDDAMVPGGRPEPTP